MLFFGNLWQDLTEFVLSDLGLVRYEDYQIAHFLQMSAHGLPGSLPFPAFNRGEDIVMTSQRFLFSFL